MERILIEGVVEHGRRLGRELGFPTANLAVPEDVAAALDGAELERCAQAEAVRAGRTYDTDHTDNETPRTDGPAVLHELGGGEAERGGGGGCHRPGVLHHSHRGPAGVLQPEQSAPFCQAGLPAPNARESRHERLL